ncbi:MAG: 4a-hydroxytetrahydrobiopterin dehydratase [Planctomycetota bacterium]
MEPLTAEAVEEALAKLPGWAHRGDVLTKEFQFSDFREAMSFIVRVGFAAESQGHHPELFNVYNKVTIGLTTHDAGGKVTQNDVDLAEAIEGFNWVPKKN